MPILPQDNPRAGHRTYYRIADLVVAFDSGRGRLCKQARAYELPSQSPPPKVDMVIDIPDDFFERKLRENPHLTPDSLLYILTGTDFIRLILDYSGIGLHASAVVCDGRAYLFSADSGVGKSTHTQLWCRHFGRDRAFILNDDKPVIRLVDGAWYVYGTPWSGKSDLNRPLRVPLAAIAFLRRGIEDTIRPVAPPEAVYPFMSQTLRPAGGAQMEDALDRMIGLIKTIPIFQLCCTPTTGAVRVAYAAMCQARPFQQPGSGEAP